MPIYWILFDGCLRLSVFTTSLTTFQAFLIMWNYVRLVANKDAEVIRKTDLNDYYLGFVITGTLISLAYL